MRASAAKMNRHGSCLFDAVSSFIPASLETIFQSLGFVSCITCFRLTDAHSLGDFNFSAQKCACAIITVIKLLSIVSSEVASSSDFSVGVFGLLIILLGLSVCLSIRAQYNAW